MTGGPLRAVLRPGDWVSFDGGEHQVLALVGTSVRLRGQNGAEQVVLASYLMAAPDFAVIGGEPTPSMEPFGLLDSLPGEVLAAARDWERHVLEVETGLAPDAEPGASPRPEYDPQARTLAERTQAKADELGVGTRTIDRVRALYAQQGLWGLVDRRAVRAQEATGRADARLIAVARQVIEGETHASTGTRGRLIRQVIKAVEDAYGPGVVPLPGRTSFYKLLDALAEGRHTFGSAVTRRQAANRPERPFTPDVRRPAWRAGADRLHPDRHHGAAGVRDDGPRGPDHRGGRGHQDDLRSGAAPGGHQGSGRGAATGKDAGARADAARMGGGAAHVRLPAAARPPAGRRRPDGDGGGQAGDRAGHHRHR
jgi:hypothetical protein